MNSFDLHATHVANVKRAAATPPRNPGNDMVWKYRDTTARINNGQRKTVLEHKRPT